MERWRRKFIRDYEPRKDYSSSEKGVLTKIFNLLCPPRLHPSALATKRLRRISAGRVMAGPFAGMKYVARSIGSAYEPKLLGTYELELHPLVTNLCARKFPLIINVGAGEGYYAVGMAMRCPSANVIAFEGDHAGQELIRQAAQLNGVGDRVTIKGMCAPDDLAEFLTVIVPSLLVMDVEGGELSLLQPETIPALADCHILVELHDFIHPGLSAEIEARFRLTHRIEIIRQRGRRMDDLPLRSRWLDRWMIRLTDEQRPTLMDWFYMQPLAERQAAANL